MTRSRLALALVLIGLLAAPARASEKGLRARFVPGPVPLDPADKAWSRVAAVQVPMLPQSIALPRNMTPSVTALTVRALHTGTWIAFHLTWKDATRNAAMVSDAFLDAVALQVPFKGKPSVTMGEPEGRVLILHWKADWQEDIDRGFQDVAQLYPNAWADWYPFAPGEPPHDITAWSNPEAQRYLTGWVLGNPRSQPLKRVSVEEQIAEGFGTLTTSPRQSAIGQGAYAEGEWRVVIARPFVTGDANDPAWGPGAKTVVAFAAWDGGKGEIGSRKSFSDWIRLRIAPAGK